MNSHQRLLALALLLVSLFSLNTLGLTTLAASRAPDITVSPTSLEIRVGNTAKVTITSTEPIGAEADVVWSNLGDSLEVVGTDVSGNTAVTTLSATKLMSVPRVIKVTLGGVEKTVKVTTLTSVVAGDIPADLGDTLETRQGDVKRIRLNNLQDVDIPEDGLEVSSDNPAVTAEITEGTIVITGRVPGSARINIKSNGETLKTFLVNVSEAPKAIESNAQIIRLTVGKPIALSSLNTKVIGKAGGDLTEQFPPAYDTDNSDIAKVAEGQLVAVRTLKGGELAPSLKITAGGLTKKIPIDVAAAFEDLSLTAPGSRVVSIGQPVRVDAQVLDSDKQLQTIPEIEWSISDADSAFLDLQPHGSYALVIGKAPHNDVKVTARIRNSDLAPKVISFDVKDRAVQGFTLLRIRIDLLDSQTAKDLFGKKANDEFYIAKIRLFNKAKNANNEFGDSILVYSESLELSVQLEMRPAGGGVWTPLTTPQYVTLFGPTYNPFDPKQVCSDPIQPNFDARYRPYTFDIVANTHDRRDDRSTRSRILTLARGVSSLTSFVTAIAVPGSSSDLPLGLDKFQNLLIPSFEKLVPSLKEVQRQNIITMVMRPLEEIPFGSDITRILFIPKGKLVGMIPDKTFRIGGVSTTGACAEVGIITKTRSGQ